MPASHQGYGRSRARQNPAGEQPLAFEQQLAPHFLCDTTVKRPVLPVTHTRAVCPWRTGRGIQQTAF